MDPLTVLSARFDPLRPLEADETDLYVDWRDQLDAADDVKGERNKLGLRPHVATPVCSALGEQDGGLARPCQRR